MIHIGTKTVTTPGTRVPLMPVRTIAYWVQVDAIPPGAPPVSNTGLVYVGDKTVTSSNGHILASGDTQFYPYTGALIYNLNEIYIDAATASDGVRFTYGS